MKLLKNTMGFSALEVALVVIVMGIVGGSGYYVYDQQVGDEQSQENTQPEADSNTEDTTPDTSTFSLDGGVSFTADSSWTSDGVGCIKDSPMFDQAEYVSSMGLLPGEKLSTIYGSGTEFFHVNVCVFNNTNDITPKAWFTNADKGGIGQGTGGTFDTSTSMRIGGNPAFYRKISSQTGGYEEVHYTISAKGKIVYVWARTYEVTEELPGLGDFRKFETPIKDLVQTISVE